MAYVNVAEWSPDQVSEWLKGLDDVIVQYIYYFVNNQVDGKRLLQLTSDELPSLHVIKIGHQEIILQGVELLRNIHYQLHQENVQYLALRLSSKARSIYNELRVVTSSSRNGGGGSAGEDEDGEDDDDDGVNGNRGKGKKKQERVSTAVIAGVADVLSSVKGLVSWLNRQPFAGVEQYDCLKNSLVDMSIRLATIAQRDMFAENQATVILQSCQKLAQISDKIIQEYNDPLIIQPASLDIATIKKKADDEWGVMLQGSYHGIHQVSGVRNLSPAHQCGKLEEGDELVQVNYQTVVGWSPHKVLAVMQESPVEVILTIKKRPRHANTVTQIYFKPFRLPSKKRICSPWSSSVQTSTRYDLEIINNLPIRTVDKDPVKLNVEPEPRPKSSTPPPVKTPPSSSLSDRPRTASGSDSDESDLEDEAFLSDSEFGGSSPPSVRLYHPKPRAPVQRRATIPGATARPTFSIDQLLQDVRWSRGGLRGCPEYLMPSNPDLLRGSGGNNERRPYTCIGTGDKDDLGRGSLEKILKEESLDGSEREKDEEKSVDKKEDKKMIPEIDLSAEGKTEEKRVVNVIPLPPRKPTNHPTSSIPDQGTSGKVSHRTVASQGRSPLPSGKGQPPSLAPLHTNAVERSAKQVLGVEVSPEGSSRVRRVSEDRPKLDKSHSTPAYDTEDNGSGSVAFPSTIAERSPTGHASPSPSSSSSSTTASATSSKFFSTLDSKSALMPSSVPQQGSCSARNIPSEQQRKIATTLSATVGTNGDGVKKHFKSQVVFPVVVAGGGSSSYGEGGGIAESAENAAVGRKSGDAFEGVHEERLLHGSVGDGSSGARKLSASSAGGEKSKVPQTLQLAIPASASEAASASAASVVLRETRSSSPSVWRRGLLVTDRGNRRISCRDLGQGDHQGWLYRRRDNKGFLLSHRWERRWFILKKNYLYGYRDREAVRADSLVYLPGFHVCPASDVKSKKYAFKIYHSSGATFYFACDTSEERSRWMSQMGLSAISSLATHQRQQTAQQQNHWEEVYYSETDEELEDRTSPSRRSPQSSRSRVSPSQESISSLWRGSSASPSRPQSRGAQPTSGKSPALRFLQPARDTNQPVPTASFRSYRRVSESNSRSTSTGDLRGPAKVEPPADEKGSGTSVTRKNSLRDRLRQIPASFTLERRKTPASRAPIGQQDQQKPQSRVPHQSCNVSDHTYRNSDAAQLEEASRRNDSDGSLRRSHSSLADKHGSEEPSSEECSTPVNSHRPHYMLPTCASSHHMPLRPSSVDLDTRNSASRVGNGRWCVSPPPSGRCSPSKPEHNNRRGSIGGESPVRSRSPMRSRSPRRGSLDCLASSSHSRALSPTISPLTTPTRSSHGSASSLLASEEYREGSPEKLWISSLRSDTSKPRQNVRSSPEKKEGRSRSASGETHLSDRLKRTALYHPPQLRNRGDSMKAAFELALDPTTGVTQLMVESQDKSHISVSTSSSQVLGIGLGDPASIGRGAKKLQTKESTVGRASTARAHSVSRPEVPPRTKFLSPSERTLPISTSLSGSTPVITCRSSSLSPSPSSVSITSTKSTSSLPGVLSRQATSSSASSQEDSSSFHGLSRSVPKPVPNLTITTLSEEVETKRTPLKPAMGVSMIGKQRRTPGVMSPRDVFFTSPPASPTVQFSSNIIALVSPTAPAAAGTPATSHALSTSKIARNQKILPHYPGMEYPPVFEPGSYSLCSSPPDNQSMLYQNPSELKLGYAGSETDSFSANFATSDSSLDMESGTGSCDVQPQVEVSSREAKSHRSVNVLSSASASSPHQNFYTMNPSGARSPQNVYVTSPVASRSHQNLYVTSPGYSSSNQNLYVSCPTVRSSSHQNIYVTSPVASSSSHRAYSSTATTTPAVYSTTQVIQVGTGSSSTSSVDSSDYVSLESSDGTRASNPFPAIEETSSEDGSLPNRNRRRMSPKPQGSPRLYLPGPPETPPSDDDDEAHTNIHL